MMKTLIFFIMITLQITNAQTNYGTPDINSPLPEKLKNLRTAILVQHFPKENDPIKIDNTYYWKHTTTILSKESDILINEYGAYLFYNDKWNLRKIYNLKDLDKTFGTKKQILLQGQPYVWSKNWRTGKELFGGWAMWYFIGTTKTGEIICGYETLNTTTNLLN